MRFYILPVEQGKTVCVNFDHVSNIRICGPTIELYFAGVEAPMVVPKTPTSLSTVAKGMDLSESSKEQVNAL
jgi:hypothetical protein